MPTPENSAWAPGRAFLNQIGTATPRHAFQARFLEYVAGALPFERDRRVFLRMAAKAGIEQRYSVLAPAAGGGDLDTEGFYRPGHYPSTKVRMERFDREALPLVEAAIDDLDSREGPAWRSGLTHLIVTCCTGFAAPGIDQQVIERFDLPRSIERTTVGFMGCAAAFNALKLARHIVRSEPAARVLVLNLELCTLHFQEIGDLEQALLSLLFADGCAVGLVSGDPGGLELDRFCSALMPGSADDITWHIGDRGFDMKLSGAVPRHIGRHLPAHVADLLGQDRVDEIGLWAVHPGGRSVLDAVEESLELNSEALAASRGVLRRFGNMSSATVMFVLRALLDAHPAPGERGVAIGFGPGIGVESFAFRSAAA